MTAAPTDAEQLARLRVAAASGHLPPDLATWVLERVTVPVAARKRERAELLRRAAAMVPGTRWVKVRALQAQIAALRCAPSTFDRFHPVADSFAGLVLLALRIAPDCPVSRRQLLRIVGDDVDE
jgi:hypothetical protein